MFTSKQQLHLDLGVDTGIAQFFVDRKVPENNMYWKGRLLYVAGGTGYLFIPLFYDLQFKCGVSYEKILDEEYIRLMEYILHSAARYEFEEISFVEHLENCKNILKNRISNYSLYNNLLEYFNDGQLKPYKNLGTSSKALNRADTFLFSICFLDLDKHVTDTIINNWYALVPSFLLMDDIYDLREDRKNNEENSVSDFGPGNEGLEKAIKFLRDKSDQLKNFNIKLGMYFENSLEKKIHTTYMQSLLND